MLELSYGLCIRPLNFIYLNIHTTIYICRNLFVCETSFALRCVPARQVFSLLLNAAIMNLKSMSPRVHRFEKHTFLIIHFYGDSEVGK